MKAKALVYLAVATLLFVVAAYVVNSESPAFTHSNGGDLVLPDFGAKINDAAKIVIQTASAKFTIERKGDDWVVADKYDYPAKYDLVKGTLVALAQLRTVDAKTSQPALYSRLQVSDPGEKDGKSAELTVEDAQGHTLASLILGKARESQGGDSNAVEIYVRKRGDAQSWLATGTLQRTDEIKSWMARDIVAFDQNRMRTVAVTPTPDEAKELEAKAEAAQAASAKPAAAPKSKEEEAKAKSAKAKRGKAEAEAAKPALLVDDRAYALVKDKPGDDDFALQDVPADKKVKSAFDIDQIGAALATLTADDVLPAKDLKPESVLLRSLEYRSFDGAIVDLQLFRQAGKVWVKIAARVDPKVAAEAEAKSPAAPAPAGEGSTKLKSPAEVAEEMKDLAARTKDWVFALGSADLTSLEKTFSDLVEAKDAAKPKS
jgi:hypothetical protein